MSLAALALKQALQGLIRSDPVLVETLGHQRLLPREITQLPLPFLTETGLVASDNSTATEAGEVIEITYTLYSEAFGLEAAYGAAARLKGLLEGARPSLPGLTLVSIDHLSTRARPDARSRATLTELTFRAAVEIVAGR